MPIVDLKWCVARNRNSEKHGPYVEFLQPVVVRPEGIEPAAVVRVPFSHLQFLRQLIDEILP